MSNESTTSVGAPSSNGAHANTLVTKFVPSTDAKFDTVTWMVRVMNLGMEAPGFLSAEIIPPYPPDQLEWMLVQKFRSPEHISAWRNSPQRTNLIKEMSDAAKSDHALDEEVSGGARGSVATAVITQIRPGKEKEYRTWEGKMQVRQAAFPGYRGSYVQPPTSDSQNQWTTLLRFDTPETLEKWFHSSERQELLKEAGEIVASTDFRSLSTAFPGWFPMDEKTGESPAPWKTGLLVLLGLFPIVMLEIKFLNPLLKSIPPSPANFMGNALSVGLTTYTTIPGFIKLFGWWLLPPKENRMQTDIKGLVILIICFAAEILACWNLLL